MGCNKMLIVVMTVVLVSWTSSVQAEIPVSLPCIPGLIGCSPYISNMSVVPGEECCGPLKVAFETQLDCLCAIFKNPDFGKQLNFTMDQGMALPGRCGIKVAGPDMMCTKVAKPPTSTPGAPPATNSSTATAPPPKDKNAAAKSIAFAGPAVSGLVMLAGFIMFY